MLRLLGIHLLILIEYLSVAKIFILSDILLVPNTSHYIRQDYYGCDGHINNQLYVAVIIQVNIAFSATIGEITLKRYKFQFVWSTIEIRYFL